MKKLIYILLTIILVLIIMILFQYLDIKLLENLSYIATIIACVVGAISIPFAVLQLKEIKKDRLLSQKPILYVENVQLCCNKPKLFRYPDFSEIFLSHYTDINFNVANIGDSSALDIDVSYTIKIKKELDKNIYKKFDEVDKRNITRKHGYTYFTRNVENISILKSDSNKELSLRCCLFNSHTKKFLLESLLRTKKELGRPILEFNIIYKNLTGAYFKYQIQFEILGLKNKEKVIEFIKIIDNNEDKYVKEIKQNKNLLKIGKEDEFFDIFKEKSDNLNSDLNSIDNINLTLIEVPNSIKISNISKNEYLKYKKKCYYGIFLDG